jgi:hypothetical protein
MLLFIWIEVLKCILKIFQEVIKLLRKKMLMLKETLHAKTKQAILEKQEKDYKTAKEIADQVISGIESACTRAAEKGWFEVCVYRPSGKDYVGGNFFGLTKLIVEHCKKIGLQVIFEEEYDHPITPALLVNWR